MSGLSSTVLMTEKTAVLTPMPTAMTMIAMAVKPGVLASERRTNLRSRQRSSIQGMERYCHTRSRVVRGLPNFRWA